jgi:hypothetical protein
MARGNPYYRRRQPLITDLPRPAAPRQLVPAPKVYLRREPPFAGRMIHPRPPAQGLSPPIQPRLLPPQVVQRDTSRAALFCPMRPPLRFNAPPRLLPPRVIRPDVLERMRAGFWRKAAWLSSQAQPFHKTDRMFWLRAAATNVFTLRASVGTLFNLRASMGTVFSLRASETMSVPANLSFFQGEDIQLNFALTPPTDITG